MSGYVPKSAEDSRAAEGLSLLGQAAAYRRDYAPEVLETFINKHPDNDYWVRFNCPESFNLNTQGAEAGGSISVNFKLARTTP